MIEIYRADPAQVTANYILQLAHKTGYLWPSPEDLLKEWFHGRAWTWIFTVNGEPAGAAHVVWEEEGEPPFGHFCFEPVLFGKKALETIKRVLSDLKERGVTAVRGVMRRSNALAVRFAERLGCQMSVYGADEVEVILCQ